MAGTTVAQGAHSPDSGLGAGVSVFVPDWSGHDERSVSGTTHFFSTRHANTTHKHEHHTHTTRTSQVLGGRSTGGMFQFAENPLAGLMIGCFATVLVQVRRRAHTHLNISRCSLGIIFKR